MPQTVRSRLAFHQWGDIALVPLPRYMTAPTVYVGSAGNPTPGSENEIGRDHRQANNI
jgi:hypothetical protein